MNENVGVVKKIEFSQSQSQYILGRKISMSCGFREIGSAATFGMHENSKMLMSQSQISSFYCTPADQPVHEKTEEEMKEDLFVAKKEQKSLSSTLVGLRAKPTSIVDMDGLANNLKYCSMYSLFFLLNEQSKVKLQSV